MDSLRPLPRSTVLNSVKNHPLSQQELDDSQTDLSSVLSDLDNYNNLVEATEEVLDCYSNTAQPGDNTCQILRAFQSRLRKRGRSTLMAHIRAIGNQPKLAAFARYLSNNILKPMKLMGGVSSVVGTSDESPNAKAAHFIYNFAANVQSSNRSQQSTLKEDILKRDGFRCAFSRVYDSNSAENDLVQPHAGARVLGTELAHILPIGLSKFNEEDERETEAVASIWYALYRYFPELESKIGPGSLNQHANLITFEHNVHRNFDNHKLAFYPRQSQFVKYPLEPDRDIMTLVASSNSFPLPNPDFFWVHHQIAQILEVSGIGAKIEAEIKASQRDPANPNPDGSTDLGAILSRKMLMDV
ncbi:hypothetical protein LZ32DRAFT_634838 [Colletotrichum eremochloae]|nr:hypothetical protein LZ32DRAFT_634838 [Colletotrichum eremochloae]